jgi:hypothetical protein
MFPRAFSAEEWRKLDRGIKQRARALNAFLTCCLGQRMGIFAGSGVGKSVLLSMLARQASCDAVVVGLIGERGREVKEFIEQILGEDGLARSAVVAAPADNSALSRITASQREAALIMATRLLDSAMEWKGWKTEETQALRWPRTGVANPDGAQFDPDTYPFLLEHATVELALVLLTRDTTARPTALGLGVTEVKLGPMSAKIDSKAQEDAIPQSILSILSPLGSIESEASTGSRVVPLWRS